MFEKGKSGNPNGRPKGATRESCVVKRITQDFSKAFNKDVTLEIDAKKQAQKLAYSYIAVTTLTQEQVKLLAESNPSVDVLMAISAVKKDLKSGTWDNFARVYEILTGEKLCNHTGVENAINLGLNIVVNNTEQKTIYEDLSDF